MKKIIKKRIKIILPAIFVLVFSILFYNLVFSSLSDNISGYGWNAIWVDRDPDGSGPGLPNGTQDLPSEREGGMGWLSFNCTGPGTCGATSGDTIAHPNYGLNLVFPSGTNYDIGPEGASYPIEADIVGWVWSPNYGWLKFGDFSVSDFPTGAGYPEPVNATFVGTVTFDATGVGSYTGYIKGWARFCAPTANPSTCTNASGGFVSNDKNGGWDGWVSLRGAGANPDYGVQVSPDNAERSKLSGYAWGGNDDNSNFVGWINFEGGFIRNKNYGLNFTANHTVVNSLNAPTTLSWSSAIPGLELTDCVANSNIEGQQTIPSWTGDVSGTPGSKSVSVPYDPTWYQITCEDINNNNYTKRVSVDVVIPPPPPPTVNLVADCSNPVEADSCTILVNVPVNLTWTSQNAETCTATAVSIPPSTITPGGFYSWSGTKAIELGSPGENYIVPVGTTTFTLTCTNESGSGSNSVTINGNSTIKKPKYNEN